MSKLSVKLRNRNQACLMHCVVLCVLYVGLSSCSDGAPSRPAAGESGEASFAIRMGKAVAATLARAEVVITGSDMDDVRQELSIQDNVVTGLVRNIPAGDDRLFTLNGYDSSGNLAYTGSATADVVAGQQVTVRITMRVPAGRKIYWVEIKGVASILRTSYQEWDPKSGYELYFWVYALTPKNRKGVPDGRYARLERSPDQPAGKCPAVGTSPAVRASRTGCLSPDAGGVSIVLGRHRSKRFPTLGSSL